MNKHKLTEQGVDDSFKRALVRPQSDCGKKEWNGKQKHEQCEAGRK